MDAVGEKALASILKLKLEGYNPLAQALRTRWANLTRPSIFGAASRTVTWLNGLETVALSEVQRNAPIDAAKFARPAPPAH